MPGGPLKVRLAFLFSELSTSSALGIVAESRTCGHGASLSARFKISKIICYGLHSPNVSCLCGSLENGHTDYFLDRL